MTISVRRWITSAFAAGLFIYAVGFATFGTSLYSIGYSSAPPQRIAALQDAIASTLGPTGTGAYDVPNPKQPETAARLERGPVATVFFETSGLGRPAANSVVGGILVCLLTGAGLAASLLLGADLQPRRRLAAIGASVLTFAIYRDLGQPIFNAYGWRYFVFLFAQDAIATLGGLFIAMLVQTHRRADAHP